MLATAKRLDARSVREVLKGGVRVASQHLTVTALTQRSLKAAAVVSSKVTRSAVQRNAIRRLIYDLVRTYPEALDAHIVIRVQKNAHPAREVLQKELWSLFSRIP